MTASLTVKSLLLHPRGIDNVQVLIWACLSVFRSHISRNTRPNFTKFSVHVIRGRSSVLLRRQWNMLCISGFVDDVMFSHGRYGAWRWQYRREGRSGHQIVINFQRIPQVAPYWLCRHTQSQQSAPRWRSLLSTIASFSLRGALSERDMLGHVKRGQMLEAKVERSRPSLRPRPKPESEAKIFASRPRPAGRGRCQCYKA